MGKAMSSFLTLWILIFVDAYKKRNRISTRNAYKLIPGATKRSAKWSTASAGVFLFFIFLSDSDRWPGRTPDVKLNLSLYPTRNVDAKACASANYSGNRSRALAQSPCQKAIQANQQNVQKTREEKGCRNLVEKNMIELPLSATHHLLWSSSD